MKTIEKQLNLFFFCLYRADYRLLSSVTKIFPTKLLFKLSTKLSIQKRTYKGALDAMDSVLSNKYYGLSVSRASGTVMGVLFFFIFAVMNIFIGLLSPGMVLSLKHVIPMAILPYAIHYFYVRRNDKYIHYFSTFEKLTSSQIRTYSWFSVAVIGLVIALFFFGLRLASPSVKIQGF